MSDHWSFFRYLYKNIIQRFATNLWHYLNLEYENNFCSSSKQTTKFLVYLHSMLLWILYTKWISRLHDIKVTVERFWYFGRSKFGGERPMKSLLSIFLSVCLSVFPSVRHFLKIGLLVFSEMIHDDSWPWYLLTEGTRFFFLKKIGVPHLEQIGQIG